ncbi:pyruvate dehydrogenase complex dihydrolipoyllysine-residue acetyltransferase, partial [Rhodococcus sp. F64268]|nr:pyruvate dehydrogenase complex dihydrolipoyllysine-residue acetyltransferase [Rhodococcus sp. F64268]
AGILTEISAQEDDTVEVGGQLAVIGSEAPAQQTAAAPAAPAPAAEKPAEAAPAEAAPAAATPAPSTSNGSGTPVTMPALGESVTEGTVTRWLKAIGDEV